MVVFWDDVTSDQSQFYVYYLLPFRDHSVRHHRTLSLYSILAKSNFLYRSNREKSFPVECQPEKEIQQNFEEDFDGGETVVVVVVAAAAVD